MGVIPTCFALGLSSGHCLLLKIPAWSLLVSNIILPNLLDSFDKSTYPFTMSPQFGRAERGGAGQGRAGRAGRAGQGGQGRAGQGRAGQGGAEQCLVPCFQHCILAQRDVQPGLHFPTASGRLWHCASAFKALIGWLVVCSVHPGLVDLGLLDFSDCLHCALLGPQ